MIKKCLFVLLVTALSGFNGSRCDTDQEVAQENADDAAAEAANKASAGVKLRTIGDRITNLTSPLVACECAQGTRMTLDCNKLCTGTLRGGWKDKTIQLTNKGFRCICNRANYDVPCTSLIYPKACGRADKLWTGKVSWNSTKGSRIFDSFNNTTSAQSCPLPNK
jgi:hypothetical protein